MASSSTRRVEQLRLHARARGRHGSESYLAGWLQSSGIRFDFGLDWIGLDWSLPPSPIEEEKRARLGKFLGKSGEGKLGKKKKKRRRRDGAGWIFIWMDGCID